MGACAAGGFCSLPERSWRSTSRSGSLRRASQLTLREADGRVQPIALAASTRIVGFGRVFSPSTLGHGWRVLVTWPANGPAELVQVETRGGRGNGGSHGGRHTARARPPLS